MERVVKVLENIVRAKKRKVETRAQLMNIMPTRHEYKSWVEHNEKDNEMINECNNAIKILILNS